MSSNKKIIFSLALLLAIFLMGSGGYWIIEGWDFFDGLYMTVTTLTTVGYGEVHPLSKAGRIFTMCLLLSGIGLMFYAVGLIAQVVVEGQLREVLGRRKLEKEIYRLKDHFIICGLGRTGEVIAREFKQNHVPFIVVDHRSNLLNQLEKLGYLHVIGNATHEDVLQTAGIERARGLVAAVSTDADNVYIVLTARSLSANLLIVARAGEEGSEKKLLRAGADKVVAPYEIGGRSIVQNILRPTVVDFLNIAFDVGMNLSLEEIPVSGDSEIVGLPLKDSGIRQKLDLIIIAIKRQDGHMSFNPKPDTKILAGDILIALGAKASLDQLVQMLK
jgi:voltage-gated potassium channel